MTTSINTKLKGVNRKNLMAILDSLGCFGTGVEDQYEGCSIENDRAVGDDQRIFSIKDRKMEITVCPWSGNRKPHVTIYIEYDDE